MGKFSNKLTSLRHKHNYSISDVAKKLGVSERRVLLWESGRVVPAAKDIEKIAALYRIKVKELTSNNTNGKDVVRGLMKFLVFIAVVAIGINVWVLRFMIKSYPHMAPGPAITLCLLVLIMIVLIILMKNNKRDRR